MDQKWLKYFKTKQNAYTGKCAEKILLGYQTVRTSLKHLILYREVNALETNLDFYVGKPHKDSEGFTVGVRRERIYESMNTLKQVAEQFMSEGWLLEAQSCDPEALRILAGDLKDVV